MGSGRFLYITPYFPPMSRVGALRPLKFVRHLPAFGWTPVVLCDLRRGDATNGELLDAVPEGTTVVWDYGRNARANKHRYDRGELGHAAESSDRPAGLLARLATSLPAAWLPSPELVPLGEHSIDMPHALAAARRVLADRPCDAIVVNADPYAALLVGARLARETKLPLVLDLRDPWSVCSLRRPRRPAVQRAIVDRLEHRAVRTASAVVLNTQTARDDYVAHYADLPADRFHTIHNHADPELIANGEHPGFDRFTVLFMGGFRRFVEGHALLEALAELKRRGLDAASLQLVVSGACPPSTHERARELGVANMLADHPFVPYPAVGPLMAAADLLVSLSNDTQQRFPAKIFDYLASRRPILVSADTRELVELVRDRPGVRVCGRSDAMGMADAIEAEYGAGRQRRIERVNTGLDSTTASKALAAILDRVTSVETHPSSRRDAK